MKHKLLLFFLMLALANVAISQNIAEREKAQRYLAERGEVRFEFKLYDFNEINKIGRIVSIDNVKGYTIEAYANKKEFEKFQTLGLEYKVIPAAAENTKSLTMAHTVAEMANWDKYPTHDVYTEMMLSYASDYPNICRIDTLGESEDGRQVLVAKITDNPDADEQEPEFYYTGQMHGDEIVAYILFLRLIDYMLESYDSDPRISNLINNYEIWINPLSNPDGTYSGGNNSISGATRGNSNGVDLNRNFPSPTYPNPTSQNEAEIQMQIAFAEEHNFVMSANSHSGIEVINYPWDSWTSNVKTHADHNWFDHISHNYADTVHNYSISGYMTAYDNGVTHGGDWYVVDGSRQDHMVYYQNCREVTFELSDAKMIDAEELPAHWTYNREAMLGYIEECMYGFNGKVENSDGEPLNAKIEITAHDEDNSEVYTDPATGDYYRPIEPGTYEVTYSSYGYISQTHTITIAAYETTVVKDVVLSSSTSVSLSGTVVDGSTGNPVENVSVELIDVPLDPATTNANGSYSFPNILEDTYQFKVTHADYATVIETHEVTASNNVIDFVIFPSQAISFEDGNIPNEFEQGDVAWTIDNTIAHHGSYCLKSGSIGNDDTSLISLTIDVQNNGVVSFFKKVSSEEGYDFLKFYIDGNEKGSWSDEVDWSEESYNIEVGTHTLKWAYEKDDSQQSGSDCAWIDYIILPPTQVANPILSVNTDSINVTLDEGASTNQDFDVSNIGEGTLNYTIEIEDAANHTWLTISQNSGTLSGSESDQITATIDASSLTEGEYTTNINVSDGTKIIKTVVVTAEVDALSIENISANDISISPNPFKDEVSFSINAKAKQSVTVKFYNLLGENMLTQNVELAKGKNKVFIDTKILNTGCYIYRIESANASIQGKLIKE